jgi:glycosyltransferase involved in cell wall biosynthesis
MSFKSDSNSPYVSVIMTTLNSVSYVKEAIDSILAQSYSYWELIIVDGGSTDGTIDILQKYVDPRIRIFICDGLRRSAQLNYAIEKVRTPFIAFMDSDDISMPNRLEKQLNVLQQNAQIGVVSSWYRLIDEAGRDLNKIRMLPEYHPLIEYEMTIHCSVCFGGMMMHRELMDKVGKFNELLQSAIDYDLVLRLLSITIFYNIQESLLHWRMHSNSISSYLSMEQRSHTRHLANKYLLDLLERTSISDERRKIYFRFGLNEYYHGTMRTARKWFIQAIPKYWTQWKMWRYIIPTLLGDTFFLCYRKIHNRNRM